MRTARLTMIPLAFSLLLLSGCGDSHEKVMRDSIGVMKQMVSILKEIDNGDDAKKAKPRLEALATKRKSIEARMKKLGDPPKAKQEELEAKFKTELESLMPEMIGLSLKMMNPEIQKEIGSVMSDMEL